MMSSNPKILFILIGAIFLSILFISCNKTDEKEEPTINYSWIPVGYQLDIGTADALNSPINIYFINEQTGFLSNESMESFSFVRTDDGCITFIDISDQIDGFVKEICFPDDQTGYLVTNNISHNTDHHSVYKTIDQGETWSKIKNSAFNKVVQVGSNFPENVFIMCQDPYSFLYSNDGGNNWVEYDLELDTFFGLTEVKFQFLENDPSIGFFNNMQNIFKTTNGGESWEEYFEFTKSTIKHYWFIDINIAYIASTIGGVHKTIESGTNFQKLASFYTRNWQIISQNEIYAVQVTTAYQTFDEFENFEVMEVNTPTDNKYDKYIRDISFYESKKGYALSGNGFVYKTAD